MHAASENDLNRRCPKLPSAGDLPSRSTVGHAALDADRRAGELMFAFDEGEPKFAGNVEPAVRPMPGHSNLAAHTPSLSPGPFVLSDCKIV